MILFNVYYNFAKDYSKYYTALAGKDYGVESSLGFDFGLKWT
jgi:hypothetical protein